jgi:GT2 family glycosyltransferase
VSAYRLGIGVVVIGRNEGDRLRRCFDSLARWAERTVYVDSGSSDASVALARARGIEVIELDTDVPFTAARARNVGFRRLIERSPDIAFVQFIDGDCEVFPAWLDTAAAFLAKDSDAAVVCGRVRERQPGASIYNLLCDLEWDRPTGEVPACGGNAMMRASAFASADGFREDLIAGEEPELCVRLRTVGWRVWRLADDMVWHDAAMTRFGQWWTRTVRAGHAFAQGAYIHGHTQERHGVRQSYSALGWGLGLPAVCLAVGLWWWPAAVLMFLLYPLQVARLAMKQRSSAKERWVRAFFLVLGKFPESLGYLKFHYHQWAGRRARLMEYK